jgi:hypothetical protein
MAQEEPSYQYWFCCGNSLSRDTSPSTSVSAFSFDFKGMVSNYGNAEGYSENRPGPANHASEFADFDQHVWTPAGAQGP